MAGLLGELGYPVPPELARGRLGRPGERVLLAELDGEPVGLLSLAVLHHVTHARPLARVVAMVVRARARRGGVGRALMERAETLARAAGCEGVELTSANSPEREAAHRFYEALGYRVTSRRYWLPLDPADPLG